MVQLESFANTVVESEAKSKSILEAAVDGIIIISDRGVIESFNPAAEKIFGYTRQEVLGKKVNMLMPQPHRDLHDRYVQSYLSTGRKKVIGIGRETTAQRKDGTTFPIELAVSEVKLGRRSIFTGIIRDITARRRSASELKASEERFRLLVETMQDGLAVQDARGQIIYVNPRFCEILGAERQNLIGRRVCDLMDIGSRIVFLNELNEPQSRGGDMVELSLEKDDGSKLSVRVTAKALKGPNGESKGSFVVITDVTQLKKLQDQLLHSQKMEAVGRLAGGIAHDFNNLLTVILGFVDLSMAVLDESSPIYDHLKQIDGAGKQAESLTRQLLAFSRKQVLQPKVISPLKTLSGIEQMLQRLVGENIQLKMHLDSHTGLITADEGQIEQVIFNLAVNARDAMPDGGTLSIESGTVHMSTGHLGMEAEIPPGNYVVLTVSDTGVGMDRKTQAQIFEPFFTTKEKGHGTGLGLSTVYGIVKQSGGEISVYSEPGRGTSFRIYLPQIDAPGDESVPDTSTAPAACGSETILVVEDEDSVRNLIIEALSHCGHNVLQAPDGPTALAQFGDGAIQVDLVLTDVVMPKMDGKEFSERFRKGHPQAKILYMSGYTDDAILEHGVLSPDTPFIHKPFSPGALTRKIQEVLVQPHPSESDE